MLQRSLINLSIELYKLLNSSSSICIFATGAASSGISSLLSASGASSTISECRIPYSRLSFIETLKEENISLSSTVSNESFSFASANASNLLAQAALSRCRRLASQEISLGNPISMKTLSKKRYIGIGVAAAVATTLPSSSSSSSSVSTSGASALPIISSPSRRGSDRIFITSLIDDGACGIETQRFEYSLHFLKKRDRIDEEAICGAVLVRAVVKAATYGTEFHLLTSIEKIIKDEIERTNTTSTSLSSFSSIETEVEIHESVYSSSTELKNTLLLKNLLSQHSKQQQQEEEEEEEEEEKSHIEDVVRHVLFVPNNTTELSSSTSTTSSSIAFANFPICINSQDSNKRQTRPLILPGSFHPLHSGHETLAKAAVIAANTLWPLNMNININKDMVDESLKSWIPFFELSVINVDKPPLELEILQSRLEQFSKRGLNVIATRAPRFIDKVDTFLESTSTSYKVSSSTSTSKDQGSYKVSSSTSTSTSKDQEIDKTNDTPTLVFVVGFDTAARLVDPKYYTGGSESAVLAALLPWLEKGVRFLVAGRIASASTYTMTTFETTYASTSEFLTFEKHLKPRLPKVLQPLFVGLDGFREDISSSELRAAK
jgi:hypothetical protein